MIITLTGTEFNRGVQCELTTTHTYLDINTHHTVIIPDIRLGCLSLERITLLFFLCAGLNGAGGQRGLVIILE